MMGMGFGLGGFGMILTWIIILGIVVFFVKFLLNLDKSRKETSSPMEILRARYASGEISKEEYENVKRDLTRI